LETVNVIDVVPCSGTVGLPNDLVTSGGATAEADDAPANARTKPARTRRGRCRI